MPKINEILDWHFSFSRFNYAADHLFNESTKADFQRAVQTIELINHRLPDGEKKPQRKLINDIYFQFMKNISSSGLNPNHEFSRRDVRILIWSLDYKPEKQTEIILYSDKFPFAIKLINEKWRDSYLIGLWHVLLKNYINLYFKKENRKLLTSIIEEKAGQYNKSRKDILIIAASLELFIYNNSTQTFVNLLIDKSISLDNANQVFNKKQHILNYQYFSNVARRYVNSINLNELNSTDAQGIYKFLEIHNSKRTTLLVCSSIINQNSFSKYQNLVKSQTIRLIGDPANEHLWKYDKLTDEERVHIEQARKKLNILINKKLINVFFHHLVQDERRKKYWLKYVDQISDIKFCGNSFNFRRLKNIESISEHVDSRYIKTRSQLDTSALIILMYNYIFVEFTDVGALYIYRTTNFKINLKSVKSISDLKVWPVRKFAAKNNENFGRYDYGTYRYNKEKYKTQDEGRITHQGYWEDRVDTWMRKYLDKSGLSTKSDTNILMDLSFKKTGEKKQNEPATRQNDISENLEKQKKIDYNSWIYKNSSKRIDNPNNNDDTWESPTLYWSKSRIPGYQYSAKKNAWWKKK